MGGFNQVDDGLRSPNYSEPSLTGSCQWSRYSGTRRYGSMSFYRILLVTTRLTGSLSIMRPTGRNKRGYLRATKSHSGLSGVELELTPHQMRGPGPVIGEDSARGANIPPLGCNPRREVRTNFLT